MKGKKSPGRSHFTIMISRGPGKVRSFRISPKLLIGSALFLILLILAAILCLYLYLDMRFAGTVKESSVEEPGQSSQTIAERGRNDKERPDAAHEPDDSGKGWSTKDKNGKGESGEVSEERPGNPPASDKGSDLSPGNLPGEKVGIEKFAVGRDGAELSVRFRITNREPSHQKIEGYVFAVVAAKEKEPPEFWSCPNAPLHNGTPVEYGKGKRFRIKNYTNIRCTFSLDSPDRILGAIHILVYDEKGELILSKEYDAASLQEG